MRKDQSGRKCLLALSIDSADTGDLLQPFAGFQGDWPIDVTQPLFPNARPGREPRPPKHKHGVCEIRDS